MENEVENEAENEKKGMNTLKGIPDSLQMEFYMHKDIGKNEIEK